MRSFNRSPNPANLSLSSPISSSGVVGKDAAPLAPAKALKIGARATPHSALQPPPVVDIVAEAANLWEAMTRGAQAAQQARAPGNGGDAGQSGVEAAAQAETMGEAGRGGADDATRPDVEVEAGRSDADSAARPVAEGAGGDAQERPASQTEMETLVPEPPRAGVKGDAEEEESAPRAPVAEETRVSVPAEARDEGVVAAMTAQAAPESLMPVV